MASLGSEGISGVNADDAVAVGAAGCCEGVEGIGVGVLVLVIVGVTVGVGAIIGLDCGCGFTG